MSVREIDPITDPGWKTLVDRHPRSSIYHSPGWLGALHATYRYLASALTTSVSDEALSNGLPFCEVRSAITGDRLVALPFSDHCEPLIDDESQLVELLGYLIDKRDKCHSKYVELRLGQQCWDVPTGSHNSETFCFHELDLTPTIQKLFSNLHKNSIQRKIRRAGREELRFEAGTSQRLIDHFYLLSILTRRRHGVPPQPKLWFQNLAKWIGPMMTIHIAYKDACPIAGILTLRHRNTLFYKYAASDERFHNLGAMPGLLWKIIEEAKRDGIHLLDLGRSDCTNAGLVTFKERWGARRKMLPYYRYAGNIRSHNVKVWNNSVVKSVIAHTPVRVLAIGGKLFYRHIG